MMKHREAYPKGILYAIEGNKMWITQIVVSGHPDFRTLAGD